MHLRIGAERYALPVDRVEEIMRLSTTTPLPGGPRALLGLVTLHGRVVPVFDLGKQMECAGERVPTRVAVVSDGAMRAGFAVDEVRGVGPLPPPAPADSPLLSGTVIAEGRLVGVLDVSLLLESVT